MRGPFGLGEGWDPAHVLTAINEALLTGICITDQTGCFVSVSKGWCSIYGVEPEQVLGQHFSMVVPPEGREAAARLHDDFIERGVEMPAEWQVRRLDGTPVWVRVGAARFHDSDGKPFKVTTVEDITARKLAEKALSENHSKLEQLNQDKDRLFSIIGHDLRGPFNPILGYADLMENLGESLTVSQALYYAGHIQSAAGHALSLLDNLLDWARLHVEAKSIMPSEQPLAPLMVEAIRVHASVAERKAITVQLEVDDNLVACVDAYMLTTIIRNLLSNALKFTSDGGAVTLRGSSDAMGVHIDIIDSGFGIENEVLQGILEGKETVSKQGTAGEPGTGLGLRVCQEMVQRLNGCFKGTSEPGRGTRFTITLPHPHSDQVAASG